MLRDALRSYMRELTRGYETGDGDRREHENGSIERENERRLLISITIPVCIRERENNARDIQHCIVRLRCREIVFQPARRHKARKMRRPVTRADELYYSTCLRFATRRV